MGSPADDPDYRGNEEQRIVLLTRGYWLGKHEVTQSQWRTMMATTPWQGQARVMEGDNSPASYISWEDAMAFCQKLTQQERESGRLLKDWQYTLPTEAQWESACRAGAQTNFHFGNDIPRLQEFAWFQIDPSNPTLQHPQDVGKKAPNAWGLRDMHGNVYEWCRDWYQERLPGGIDPLVMKADRFRVFRGGAYDYDYRHNDSASRSAGPPTDRTEYVGFRVALVPSDE
jgi:formylglycine-generating enzyme required for sulfatase activity